MNQAGQAQYAAVNPLQSEAYASLYNQSIYFIERVPVTKGIELNGGYRYQTQSATTNGISIWSGASSDSKTYSANAGDVAINFKYLEGQRVYVKWNQSYRFPNVDEFWGWSTHGVLKLECLTDGEVITEAVPYLGYLHRCFCTEGKFR